MIKVELGDCEENDEGLETITGRLEKEIKNLGKCVVASHGRDSCEDQLKKVEEDGLTFKSLVNRRHPDCK